MHSILYTIEMPSLGNISYRDVYILSNIIGLDGTRGEVLNLKDSKESQKNDPVTWDNPQT